MAFTNTTSAPLTSPLNRIASAFGALATRYKNYRLYRETFDGLSALSNRDLADLGIGRSDIRRVSIEATYY
jgi:uncharacterized protein YjiS (DUF1127 family)